jgi:hypothetical protein
MASALRLMTVTEILVGIALIARFIFPSGMSISFKVTAHASIAIPMEWFFPLLLISVAGICSTTTLIKIVWSMAQTAISA